VSADDLVNEPLIMYSQLRHATSTTLSSACSRSPARTWSTR
jgi:hypothetical protein